LKTSSRRHACALRALALAGLFSSACANGPASSAPTFFQPSRITVQELTVEPAVPRAGAPIVVRFRLVRAGDAGAPVYWTAHVLETPPAGGALTRSSGGPVASGEWAEVVYAPAGPTAAVLTLYPSSSPGTAIGDGTGDWRTVRIEVP
jgi:hypothetical protein